MKHAYSSKEITDALEWLQVIRYGVKTGSQVKIYSGALKHLNCLEQCGDNALEDAIAREKWERENEPKPQKLGDIWWGKCLDGTGFQPPEFEEDKRTAGLVQDIRGDR